MNVNYRDFLTGLIRYNIIINLLFQYFYHLYLYYISILMLYLP